MAIASGVTFVNTKNSNNESDIVKFKGFSECTRSMHSVACSKNYADSSRFFLFLWIGTDRVTQIFHV